MESLAHNIENQLNAVKEVASYLWEKGWAERNAGNISVDLSDYYPENDFSPSDRYYKCNLPFESAGLTLFVTGAGERLRDLKYKADKVSCILKIDAQAKGYNIIWGGNGNKNFKPTSEFISHLTIHLNNRERGNGHKCVLHTHPIELIALSHNPFLRRDEDLLNKKLWSMLPEVRVFVPKGIAIIDYIIPGSKELAEATVNRLNERNVVLWSKHGALSSGKDAVEAFDFIDVLNKGAIIYLKCLQFGFVPEGLTDKEMQGLEIFF